MNTKTCNRCNVEKTLDHFYLTQKRGKPYYIAFCRECHLVKENNPDRKKQKAEWHQRNKKRLKEKRDKWKSENRELYLSRKRKSNKKRKDKHNEYCKEWVKKNKESRKETSRKYAEKNRKKITERMRLYHAKRRESDPIFRLRASLRGQVKYALRNGGTKNHRTYELLGASVDFVKKHLESQFQDGMTWENYGVGGWHIDHIYPCSKFDLTDPEEQKKCFHWSNLQPMWERENKSKGDKVTCEKPDFVLEYCE